MAQQNEPYNSLDPATVPVKRKRGRPRKEDGAGAESDKRTQRRRRNRPPTTGQGLVGQPVSGILDGVFDAGFLITVQVGNGSLLRGMVFDSRLCVPISAANDVAPHLKMSKRDKLPVSAPISAEPLQSRGGPIVSSPVAHEGVVNDGSQGSAFKMKNSEAAVSGMHPVVSKEAGPVTFQIPDNQKPGLTGELKLDSSSKASHSSETAGEHALISTSQVLTGAPGGQELNLARRAPAGDEVAGELNQSTPGYETAGGLKPGFASKTPSFDEAGDLTLGKPLEEQNLDSTSGISPYSDHPAPIVDSS